MIATILARSTLLGGLEARVLGLAEAAFCYQKLIHQGIMEHHLHEKYHLFFATAHWCIMYPITTTESLINTS
jgi:hypothetical protein